MMKYQNFDFKQFSLAEVVSLSKTVPFQTIHFSISSIWPIDRTLSGATTPGQSEPGNNGNKGVLSIPGTSPSDCLVLYPGRSWRVVLCFCRDTVGVFYSPSWLVRCTNWKVRRKVWNVLHKLFVTTNVQQLV